MKWLTYNEMLFYGGIVAAIVTIVLAVIFYVSLYIRKISLNNQFDREYGEIEKTEKQKRKKGRR